ncbi:MAG: hypothetical protein NVS3B2_11940 [Ramlibacter sp.]
MSAGDVSSTISLRGASVNIGKRGTRATVGLPGTAVSYCEKLSGRSSPGRQPDRTVSNWVACIVFAVMVLAAWLAVR